MLAISAVVPFVGSESIGEWDACRMSEEGRISVREAFWDGCLAKYLWDVSKALTGMIYSRSFLHHDEKWDLRRLRSNGMTVRYILETGWQILFKDLDVSVQDVLYQARLPLDLLSRKSPTVTGDEYFRLWNGLANALRHESTFPLRLIRSITPELFSPPIFASLCSRDLNMALRRIAHYKPLVGPIRLDVEQNERQTRVAIHGLPETTPPPDSLLASELAFWVQVARIATRERIVPLRVHVALDLPQPEAYETFFGTALQRSDFNGLTFTAEDANRPFLTVNDAMWSIFEPELNKRLQSLTSDSPFRERVRANLIEILASG